MAILNKYEIFTILAKFHRMLRLLKIVLFAIHSLLLQTHKQYSQFTAFFSRPTNNIRNSQPSSPDPQTIFQSRVTPSCSVFLNKVPIIRLNTTYRSRTRVFYYTLQHVSALQVSHHPVDFRQTKRNLQGNMPLFLLICSV